MSSEGRWPPLDPSPWEPRRAARPRRPAPEPEPDPDGASRRLLHAGRDLHAVDPATGAGELVDESGTTSDLTVAGDHVVVAGVFALTALPVDDVAA